MKEVIEDAIINPDGWQIMISTLTTARENLLLSRRHHQSSYTVPQSTNMPKALSRVHFLRDGYSDFYSKLNKGSTSKAGALTGRPGTAKSMFEVYAVLRKLLEVLTKSTRTEEFKLIYVVGQTLTKIEIPGWRATGRQVKASSSNLVGRSQDMGIKHKHHFYL